MNPLAEEYSDKPCLIEKSGVVSGINKAFIELSGFSSDELLDKPFVYIWNELLRINAGPDFTGHQKEAWLFTRELKAKCIIIQKHKGVTVGETGYIFIYKPFSRLDDEFPFLDNLYSKGTSGVAIYSIPDFILIKANQTYLNFLDESQRSRANSIGRSAYSIIGGFKGSTFEKTALEIIKTGEIKELKDEPFHGYSRGTTYWDSTIVPVFEAGCIKYLIQVSREVTEAVNNRKLLAEQNKLINEQKKQLETILENMSDCICIFDKDGKYTLFNKAAREMYFSSYEYMNKMEDGHYHAENYDSEGKRIPFWNTPSYRVMRGEKFTSMRMEVRYADKIQHLEVSGTPFFDNDGSFKMGILCSRDITSLVQKESLILRQKEELLNAEIQTREALEASLKLKDEFIYLISHEMRTPSAIVSSALQAIELMYKKEITPNVKKHLNTIKQNTNRQLRLINNLLAITRISSGNIKLNRSAFDIVFLTKAIVKSVEVYGKQKEIEISFRSKLSKKVIFLDEEKYERILLNLLANAVKYTPVGKKIYVSLYTKRAMNKNMICVSVIDEGIGIPKDKKDLIFERFGQVDSSLSRQAEGTGLGLTLVKMLVEAMEGEICLDSELGKGSTFTVMLPIVKPVADIDNAHSCHQGGQLYSNDDRIVRTASIEFSDIYFD